MAYNGSQYSDNGAALNTGDAKAVAQEAMQRRLDQGLREYQNYRYSDNEAENTVQLFGFIPMDAGIASLVKGLYSGAAGEFSQWIAPSVYKTVLEHGPKLKISGTALAGAALHRTAAASVLATNLGIFLAPAFSSLVGDIRQQHQDRVQVVRQIAPVLDEVMGKHSIGAYNGVSAAGNSVIWAHRQRMSKEASSKNTGTIFSALAANILNIARQGNNMRALMTGKHRDDTFWDKYQKEAEELRQQFLGEEERAFEQSQRSAAYHYGERHEVEKVERTAEQIATRDGKIKEKVLEALHQKYDSKGASYGLATASSLIGTIAEKMTDSRQRRQKNNRQPYSTLEMILCLSEQLQNNPGAGGRFQLPKQHGRELSLNEYVAEIFKHHQREMSDLDPNYSELRQSLHEDLGALTQPIAAALEAGKLNPLMLMRLAGEGKVVKNHGRGLASETEILTVLESYEGKTHRLNTADPKDFLSERNFSLKQVKESLESLCGQEKLDYAAAFPDGVLKAAGMEEKVLHEVQSHRAKEGYKYLLMHEILALSEKPEDELKAGGLATAQVEQLRKAADIIRERGVEALEALVSSPTNADGIENTVSDFVVPKVAGDKTYLGKLVEKGKKLEKQDQEDQTDQRDKKDQAEPREALDEEEHRPRHQKKHREREDHRRNASEAANDGEYKVAANGR